MGSTVVASTSVLNSASTDPKDSITVYNKPIKYLLIHVGLGIAAAWIPWIIPCMLIYQGLQLLLKKRFFLFEWKVGEGNTPQHTVVKILEFFIGYAIALMLRNTLSI
jgi:hypothetical protein